MFIVGSFYVDIYRGFDLDINYIRYISESILKRQNLLRANLL